MTLRFKRDILLLVDESEVIKSMTKGKFSLKALRVNNNLTQSEAAEKLGIARETVCNWEIGKSFPNVKQIKMLEELYGVQYDDIIFLPNNND